MPNIYTADIHTSYYTWNLRGESVAVGRKIQTGP